MIGESIVVLVIAIVYLVSSRDVLIEREELIGRIFDRCFLVRKTERIL